MAMKNPPHPGEVVRDAIENGLGLTVTAAAEGLGVSRKTVEYHKYRLAELLGVTTTAELIRFALEHGFVDR